MKYFRNKARIKRLNLILDRLESKLSDVKRASRILIDSSANQFFITRKLPEENERKFLADSLMNLNKKEEIINHQIKRIKSLIK